MDNSSKGKGTVLNSYDVVKHITGWHDMAAMEPAEDEWLYLQVEAPNKKAAKVLAVKQWIANCDIYRADGNPFTGVKVKRVPNEDEFCPICNVPGSGDEYNPPLTDCTYCNNTGLRPGVKL